MTTATLTAPESLADLLRDLGGVPPERVRRWPAPGTAGEADLLAAAGRDGVPCELVDGSLVEKALGFARSVIALLIGGHVARVAEEADLGVVAGVRGPMRLRPGLVRAPGVSFVRWHKLPGRALPPEPIPDFGPCLAVEVIGESNTDPEMQRMTREYFETGSVLVWLVDPQRREVRVHTSLTDVRTLHEGDTLDGGTLLPGLAIPISALFARLPAPE